jgi:hypothetical protein
VRHPRTNTDREMKITRNRKGMIFSIFFLKIEIQQIPGTKNIMKFIATERKNFGTETM